MTQAKSRGKAVAIPETRAMDIPFNKLRLSDKNVRTIYDKETVAELAESIAVSGLLQSLSVRPLRDDDGAETGDYEVQAGGRRFRALELLAKKRRRAADAPTPCVVKTGGFAEDDSYVENAQREALHPIDQFRAFKAMHDAGRSETDIAKTHRVTVGFVRQRLRLAAASPSILQAYRDEDIDLEQLMAFCVTDDHARQDSVWDRMKDHGGWHANYIRQMLTEDTIRSTDRRVVFIGLDAYEQAGGVVERDLFSERTEGYLKDAELLNRLVADKLAAAADACRKQGWKWAEADVSIPHDRKHGMQRLVGEDAPLTAKEQKLHSKLTAEMDALAQLDELSDEQDARYDEINAALLALDNKPAVYARDDMANAGVFLSIGYDGALVLDAGFIRAEDRPREGSADGGGQPHGNGDVTDTANGHMEAASEETGRPLSASLVEDLTSYRTVALRDAAAQNFNVAFVSVVHALALGHFYTFSYGKTCLQLKIDTAFHAKEPGLDQWAPTKAIAARDLAWKKLLPKASEDLWHALLAMDHAALQGLFAHLASLAINAVQSAHIVHGSRGNRLRHADDLACALDMDMVKAGWVTTAENYLSRVSKDRIAEAVAEARGEETASLLSDLKKDKMAGEAERLLQGSGWLPLPLRVAETADADDDREDDLDDVEGDATAEALPEFLQAGDPATDAVNA